VTVPAAALPAPLPLVIPVARAAELLDISRSAAYALARTGQLPGVTRLGSRYVVRTAVMTRWLDGQLDIQ
jgi:hypothetical protein